MDKLNILRVGVTRKHEDFADDQVWVRDTNKYSLKNSQNLEELF